MAVRVVDKVMVRAPRSLLPKWIKPQLTRLVDESAAGGGWVHEISTTATARMNSATIQAGPNLRQRGLPSDQSKRRARAFSDRANSGVGSLRSHSWEKPPACPDLGFGG